jgi:hypothetical protein
VGKKKVNKRVAPLLDCFLVSMFLLFLLVLSFSFLFSFFGVLCFFVQRILFLMSLFPESKWAPDEVINPHPRFGTLTQNIRKRRGQKVDIRIPLYQDTKTFTNTKRRKTMVRAIGKWVGGVGGRSGWADVSWCNTALKATLRIRPRVCMSLGLGGVVCVRV